METLTNFHLFSKLIILQSFKTGYFWLGLVKAAAEKYVLLLFYKFLTFQSRSEQKE